MHIAVLDDNIADRKQLERLLDRESDRRIQTTGNLYIDSYGSVDALMLAPKKQYDFFLIDLKGPVFDSVKIINDLLAQGIQVPICLMRSENELEGTDKPEGLLYIEKPIRVADLTAVIDKALEIKKVKDEEKVIENIKQWEEELSAKRSKGLFGKLFK
ncbi:MAG: hypothetical protein K6G75_11785 [Lachnospiraceae bacterium]|nr:hypothetical protein [Lachnospiraceae bacterium]